MNNKAASSRLCGQLQRCLKTVYAALLLSFAVQSSQANPVGGNVVNGSASFAASGNTLNITNTPGTIINWQGFSINSNETTKFIQQSASSAVLNRVVGNDPSNILGTLQSNGRVFLVNPNGIMFGAGAIVDVAGLVASTLNLSNADFLAGNNHYTQVPGAGNISNAGNISTQQGGQIYLIAPNVENTGVITAPNGEILLAAGYSVDLVSTDDPNLRVNITAPAGNTTNVGQLIASSGSLGLFGTVVSNSGIVSADSATMQGGKIVFKASQSIDAGGTISANGTDGGSVDISVAHSLDPNAPGVVIQTGSIQANGSAGTGGAVSISGDSILSTAAINTDGAAAGGQISVQALNRTLSTTSAQYTADSTQGQGGNILVSADVSNYTSGSYSATGATGGSITMAGNEIKLAGAQLDASGTNGGGTINVGGQLHGAAGFAAQGIALGNATNVLVNSATTLKADALQTGNGGQVVLWSDQSMLFTGSISARGGALAGNGGSAEVSGLTSFGYGGLTDLSAANGLNGTLLLDPYNITIVAGPGLPYQEIIDPTPGAGEGFGGSQNLELSDGNIVITSPNDSFIGASSGAVYLYTAAGTLLSALTGAAAGDQVGSGGITSLTGSNINIFLVSSPNWSNGAVATAGAVTWMDGTNGLLSSGIAGGKVTSANSLVGSTTGDGASIVVRPLANGNVAVSMPYWDNGTFVDAGSVTWMNGGNGKLADNSLGAAISGANSLVGGVNYDQIGSSGIATLSNGNYVVLSKSWGSNSATAYGGPGAVTWVSGSTGNTANGGSYGATVTSANSLVGTNSTDYVGAYGITSVTELPVNGNVVVNNNYWNGYAGAATWMNGTTGALINGVFGGQISSTNSLAGTVANEQAGSTVIALTNGNYLLTDFNYNGGAGAVVFGNGTTGVAGNVSPSVNSLVGTLSTDKIGWSGYYSNIIALPNGNYLVPSPAWNSGAGAVTFGNGSTGTIGAVTASNSLIGSVSTDQVGSTVTLLSTGNYVVTSSNWTNALGVAQVGAVTWGNGTTGTVGAVSSTNSLVGSTANDHVGNGGVTVLVNGNYVVSSYSWNGGYGAATWGSGTSGTTGIVSASNSLVGSTLSDSIGGNGITALFNGNYVVDSPGWNGGLGAVTWGNGSAGTAGVVSASNSLVGYTSTDTVGSNGVTALTNGNYVVLSASWGGGLGGGLGAATWGNGTTGTVGTVSSANSLVGSNTGDGVGNGGVTELSNGNYVVKSSAWNGGFGAVTWGDGSVGTIGVVSVANSLVGSAAGDYIGESYSVTVLSNGNYVVSSSSWNGGYGAVTWGNGSTGTVGVVSAANSLVGSTTFDRVGTSQGTGNIVELKGNGNVVVTDYNWGSTSTASGLGSVTWMNGANGKLADGISGGAISASNSLVGSTAGDQVGSSCDGCSGFTIALANGNYAVISPSWTNGSLNSAGAATLGNGASGTVGIISSTNSLVGTAANEQLGSGAFELTGQPGIVFIANAAANNGYGGVYLLGGTASLVNGSLLFTDTPGTDATIAAGLIDNTLNAGTNVVLQANNDITQSAGAAINATSTGASLTLQAGHSVVLNDVIDIKGALNITASDPANVVQATGGVLDASLATLTASQVSLINYAGDVLIGTIHAGTGPVTIAAIGGNFTSFSGSATPITTTGLVSIYSTDPAQDTLNGMGSNFHRYNCTYSSGGPVCGTVGTTIPTSGTTFFYTFVPGPLTVTASPISKIYGMLDSSVLTYSVTGLIGSDTAANALNGSLSHTPTGENVGTYSITQGSLLSQMGYSITFVSNTLTITPATLTVAANATNKILSTADPPLTYTVSGLQFSDTAAATVSVAPLTRAPGETVGVYPISFGAVTLLSTNYTLNLVTANFTILATSVINEITDITVQQEKRKPVDVLVASTSPGDSGNQQTLPMCN